MKNKPNSKALELRLGRVRKLHKATRNVNGLFSDNPILKFALGLPFLVVGAVSLKHAVWLSLAMLITVVPLSMVAYLLGDKIPRFVSVCIYPILASLILMGVRLVISKNDPVLLDSLGMYINLIAVSTLLLSQIDHSSARKRSFGASLLRSFYTCGGFALVILIFGFLRELFGSGSVFGVRLGFIHNPAYGITLAFFGFIMLGFVIALARAIIRLIHYSLLKSSEREGD